MEESICLVSDKQMTLFSLLDSALTDEVVSGNGFIYLVSYKDISIKTVISIIPLIILDVISSVWRFVEGKWNLLASNVSHALYSKPYDILFYIDRE